MGNDVYLTVDIKLQKRVEEELKKIIEEIQTGKINNLKYENATCGSSVVIDVKTGEVLAIASFPDYTPQDFTDGINNEEYNNYFLNEDRPLYNRAIQGMYAPRFNI